MTGGRLALALSFVMLGCAERPLDVPEENAAVDAGAVVDLSAIADLALTLDLPPLPDLPPLFDLSPSKPLRQLAPLSTSTVTSHRPALRWQGGSNAAAVELCRDRACAQRIGPATVDSSHTQARPNAPLAPGVVFWRVRDGATVTPTWEFFVGARDAAAGSSYGTTLDVNGDGYADVGVAEMGFGMSPGAAHLYLGGPTGLAHSPSVSIPGVDPRPDWLSDWQVGSAGDLDGDGFGDFVVSSIPYVSATTQQPGIVRVYFGSSAGLRLDNVITLRGPSVDYQFGRTVGGAGDVNGDGYGDLLVTSVNETPPWFVFFGGPDGVTQADPSRFIKVDTFSQNAGDPATAGDFNGDGYGDVVFGASSELSNVGRVFVYYGGPNGMTGPTRLESQTGTQAQFGWGVAAADVDGDGYCDVIARAASSGATAYVFAGGPAGVSTTPKRTFAVRSALDILALAGDVDQDGHDDVLFGAQASGGHVSLYLGGPQTLVELYGTSGDFGFSVAGAGDIDRDGHEDLLIGSPAAGAGHVFVFAGGAGGPQMPDLGVAPLRLDGASGVDSLFGYWVAGRR